MENYIVKTTVALTGIQLAIMNAPQKLKRTLFLGYLRVRNFIFGDPNGPRKPRVESVDVFPNIGDELYDVYFGSIGVDVTSSPLASLDMETPFMADYNTVWNVLKDGLPEFEDEQQGRVVVVYRDEWGQKNKRVYPSSSDTTRVPLPFHREVEPSGMGVVHVSIRISHEGTEVYSDYTSTELFKTWIRRKTDFSTRASMYALANYLHVHDDVVHVLETRDEVGLVLSFTFADLTTYEHNLNVNWPKSSH